MKTLANTKLINKITVHDKKLDVNYVYKEEKTILDIITIQREGWYRIGYNKSDYHGDRPILSKNKLFFEGNVYDKPEVVIHYINNDKDTYRFDSYPLAVDWARELCVKSDLIELKFKII